MILRIINMHVFRIQTYFPDRQEVLTVFPRYIMWPSLGLTHSSRNSWRAPARDASTIERIHFRRQKMKIVACSNTHQRVRLHEKI